MHVAGEAGYAVEEYPLTRYDLYTADEVFLTGTAAELVGVVNIDGRAIGCGVIGPVTRDLTNRFRDLVQRESTSA
jgi:branched-chain amino acid aminotransferase